MQITRAGEYAVLGATYLARRGAGQAVMIEEICKSEDIPRSFLAKIFQSLTRAGIVRSQRGVHGGFKLIRRPEEVRLLDVLEAVEGRAVFRCQDEPVDCHRHNACTLCDLVTEAQNRFEDIFQSTTLADMIRPREEVMARVRARGPRPAESVPAPVPPTPSFQPLAQL